MRGTLVLTTVLRAASELHLTRMHLPFLLGTAITTDRTRAKAAGYPVHFAFGLVFALGYYALFATISRHNWWLGALFGPGNACCRCLPGQRPAAAGPSQDGNTVHRCRGRRATRATRVRTAKLRLADPGGQPPGAHPESRWPAWAGLGGQVNMRLDGTAAGTQQLRRVNNGGWPMARLLSVNVGLPQDISWQGRTVHTGVWKKSAAGRQMVRRLNIDGDGQGDLAGHGGEQRAGAGLPDRLLPVLGAGTGPAGLHLWAVRGQLHRRRSARRRGLRR